MKQKMKTDLNVAKIEYSLFQIFILFFFFYYITEVIHPLEHTVS